MSKLLFDEKTENNENYFLIRSSDTSKQSIGYVCQANSPELQQKWLTAFSSILQTQKDFLKALQSPIAYQKELTKDL